MATKLNRKFITVVVLFVLTALAVVGGIAYLQISGAPERNRNLGDIAMKAGEAAAAAGNAVEAKRQFTEAMNRYGRAVSKRPNNTQYIDLMRGALERIVPSTGSEANELYQRLLSVMQQRVRAKPEDGEARLAFIDAVRERAELVGTPETWKALANVCDDALSAITAQDPMRRTIERVRAEAQLRRDSVLTPEERAEAEKTLRDMLATDPSDGAAWGALLSSIGSDAVRLQRASRASDAARRVAEFDETMAKARAAAGDSPAVVLAAYDRLLARRGLGDPSVTPSQLIELGDSLIARAGTLPPGQMLEVAERIAAAGNVDLSARMAKALQAHCSANPSALVHQRMIGVLLFYGDRDEAVKTLEALVTTPQLPVSLVGAYQDELRAFGVERLGDLAFLQWESAEDDASRTAALERLRACRQRLKDMVGDRGGEFALARMDAKIAFAQRNLAEANVKLDEVLSKQSFLAPEFYMMAAQVLLQRGEFGSALNRIDRGLESFPGSIPMLSVRAEVLARLGRLADARRTIDTIATIEPTAPVIGSLGELLAQVAAAGGAATGGGAQGGSDPVGIILGKSESIYVEGKFDEALAMLNEGLAKHPDDIRLLRAKAQVLISKGKPEEAAAVIEQGLAVAPGDEPMIRLRAIGSSTSALERLERMLKDLPADDKTRAIRRVVLLAQLRDNLVATIPVVPAERKAALESELATVRARLTEASGALAAISPGEPALFELAFNDAIAARDLAAAESVVANTESASADKSLAAILRGRLAMERGDWAAAVAAFDRARAAPGAPAATWRLLGMAKDRGGDVPGALEAYAEAYQRQPSDSSNVRLYGGLLARTGEPTRALEMLRSAAAASTDDLSLFNAWLDLEAQFGDRNGALERRRRIWRDRPSDRENGRKLAVLLLEIEPALSMIPGEDGRPRFTSEQFAALPAERQRDELAQVRSRNTQEGLGIGSRLMATDPNDRETAVAMAMALRRTGSMSAAVKLLSDAAAGSQAQGAWARWLDLAIFLADSGAMPDAEAAFAKARETQPAQGMPANRAEGQFWFTRGDWARARAAIEPVFAASPSPDLARNLTEILMKLRDFDGARAALAKAGDPGQSSAARFMDAMLKASIAEGAADVAYVNGDIARGDAETATLAAALDAAIALEPGDARPWILRSAASHARYQRTGDKAALTQARVEADRAFELQPTLWPVIRQRCIALVDQGDLKAAIDTIRKFVGSFPRSEDGRRALMTYMLVAGDVTGAIQVAEDAVRLEPRNRTWYEMLAGVQAQIGKPADAAATLERAFDATGDLTFLTRAVSMRQAISPPDTAGIVNALRSAPPIAAEDPFLRLAQAAATAAQARSKVSRDEALATLRELRPIVAPALGASADRVWIDCARSAFPADRPAELERFSFDAFGSSPPTAVLGGIAEAYSATGQAGADRAKALAQQAVDAAKDPASKAGALVLLGRVLYQYGQPAESAKALAQAVALSPNDPAALNNLAYLQITELKQVSEAVANARKAVELSPGTADLLDTLGLALTRSGQHAEAVVVLSRAASIQMSNLVLLHLAEAQLGKGDRDAARRTLERVQQSRPTPDETAQADTLLSRLNAPAGT